MGRVEPLGSVPDRFNAARFFVDRHIEEGRGDRIAIRCQGGALTYRELGERVNRVGNALKGLGVSPGQRYRLREMESRRP